MLFPLLALAGIIGYVAYRTRRVSTPFRRWKRFESADATALDPSTCQALQGIYVIEEGTDFFGKTAVLKCSYTVEKEGTFYHLSLFCEKNGTYMLCEGRQQGNDVLLSGHWRKAMANGAGLVRLVISGGATALRNRGQQDFILLQGEYGNNNRKPTQKVSLSFQRPLPQVEEFDIIGHRGACRNVDFLSVSENSVEMTKMAARLGANGIEIDVRMTKDGVPVIFHDSFFSIHTTNGKIYGGLLHNHTWEEVQQFELRKGGRIPTLEEMLHTVLYQTPLEVVWLDIKKECNLKLVAAMQHDYHQKAAAMDRKLTIYIGVPDTYLLGCFKKLPDYKNVTSLIELSWQQAIDINAEVWAPQYTGGWQSASTDKVHAAGKKAYVWSLDSRFMIESYITRGAFDGLVTNAAPVVAHWLYTQGHKVKQEQIAGKKWQVAGSG